MGNPQRNQGLRIQRAVRVVLGSMDEALELATEALDLVDRTGECESEAR